MAESIRQLKERLNLIEKEKKHLHEINASEAKRAENAKKFH